MTLKRNAIITASYAPDFERCSILCETIDRHASGYECHYILVDGPDEALFSKLQGPKRKIMTDVEILPWWIRRAPAALSPGGRRVWLSARTLPLHGWHIQQIMRIAVAHQLDVDGLLYCDSDTAFLRDYDLHDMWRGDSIRLWRQPDGALTANDDHMLWVDHAAETFSLPDPRMVTNDYVCSFVTWNRQTVVDMCAHIERVHGKHWLAVVGSSRKFSECMLYGIYVDGVLGSASHNGTADELCPMKWVDPAPTADELDAMVHNLPDHAVGLGVQSFIPMPSDMFRNAINTSLKKAA
ncbi:MAG: DUF6492 family protein [Pseudomonadota bacterium]